MVIRRMGNRFVLIIRTLFRRKRDVKIGLYGPVNSGKTTLANRICVDWLGEEMGKVSAIPHETREIQMKERVKIKNNGKSLTFNLIDTPGIATKIDFEDFVRAGLKKTMAKERAKEATKGVIESIKWLDNMDMVLVVLDSTKDPINQVNITILGNLDARDIPVLIVGNKTDLKGSNLARIRNAFPKYPIIGISAKKGENIQDFYGHLIKEL
jgi:small GTP-binding protein